MKREKILRRAFNKVYACKSLSRREKKLLFGRRPGQSKLRKAFNALNIIREPRTLSEDYEFTGVDELFCPKCGCIETMGTGNMTCYPEHWEYFYCLRCGFQVGTIDNSPFCHVLAEMKTEQMETNQESR